LIHFYKRITMSAIEPSKDMDKEKEATEKNSDNGHLEIPKMFVLSVDNCPTTEFQDLTDTLALDPEKAGVPSKVPEKYQEKYLQKSSTTSRPVSAKSLYSQDVYYNMPHPPQETSIPPPLNPSKRERLKYLADLYAAKQKPEHSIKDNKIARIVLKFNILLVIFLVILALIFVYISYMKEDEISGRLLRKLEGLKTDQTQ